MPLANSSTPMGPELFDRRVALQSTAMGALALMGGVQAEPIETMQAVAFDGFTVFDPRPVALVAERLFPGHGVEFMASWRNRQFEYTWLRTLMNRYADFGKSRGMP